MRILLRIAEAPWLAELRRRVQHYGFRYSYGGAGARVPAPAFPRWAEFMAERLQPHFGGALPVQCIVNEYRSGQGIGMHTDHCDFGRLVADALPLPRRAVLVLGGAARHRWMHGIDRADTAHETVTRISATFRTLAG